MSVDIDAEPQPPHWPYIVAHSDNSGREGRYERNDVEYCASVHSVVAIQAEASQARQRTRLLKQRSQLRYGHERCGDVQLDQSRVRLEECHTAGVLCLTVQSDAEPSE